MSEFYRGHADIYRDSIGYIVDVDPCSNCTQFECPLMELQERVIASARGNSYKIDRLNLKQGSYLVYEITRDRATGSLNATGAICLKTDHTGIAGSAFKQKIYLNDGPKVIRRGTKE